MGSGQGQQGGKGGGWGGQQPLGLGNIGQQQTPYTPPQNQPQQPNTAGKGGFPGGSIQPERRTWDDHRPRRNQPQQPWTGPAFGGDLLNSWANNPAPYTGPTSPGFGNIPPPSTPYQPTPTWFPPRTGPPIYQAQPGPPGGGSTFGGGGQWGSRIGAPEGTMFTADWVDSNNDGTDDRYQENPQLTNPGQWNRPQQPYQPQIPKWAQPGWSQPGAPVERMPGWSIDTAGKGSPGARRQPQPGSVLDWGERVRQFNAPRRGPWTPNPMPPRGPWFPPGWPPGMPPPSGPYNPVPPRRPMPQLPQQGFGRWGQQRDLDRQVQDFRQGARGQDDRMNWMTNTLGGSVPSGVYGGMFRNGGVVQQSNLQGIWDRPLQDKRSDWRSRRFMG